MTPNEALNKYFGYDSFRPGQVEIINSIISGKNVLAILPTGAGKSLCYQIPAVLGNSFSIIISPLIALMKDQVDALNRNSEIASFINSTIDYREQSKVLRNLASGITKLLYIAPEGLANLKISDRLKELNPDYLFVDEAHCISEWGHNFRPSYQRIKEFASYTGIEKISAFTATATPEVRDDIIRQLGFKAPEVFIKGFERKNISVGVVRTNHKKEKSLQLLNKYGTPAIIYCSTRKNSEEAFDFLRANKIRVSYYHAGIQPEMRRIVQDDFQNNRTDVICATNAFGMGIDKKDIRLIIHYNMPPAIENYYQEIGRAGRDGNESKAVLLFEPKDKYIQHFLIKNSYPDKEQVKLVYTLLCDYSKIAVGQKSLHQVPVDTRFISICEVNGIPQQIIHASLNFLASTGVLKKVSEYEQNHKLLINLTNNELKSYIKSVASVFIRDLLIFILKKYGSLIFEKHINIKIKELADFFETDTEEIILNLEILAGAGIADYRKPLDVPSFTLVNERVEARHLVFDFNKIQELKQRALDKLGEMEKFVFGKECRSGYILKYFGEDTQNYRCGKCDNCTDFLNTDPEMEEYIQENILNTLLELNEEANEKQLQKILWGTNPFFAELTTFGSFSNFNPNVLKDGLNTLVALKKIIRSRSNYFVPENGTEFSNNEIFNSEIQARDIILFGKLKELRSEISRKFMQSPELICPDELLKIISAEKPATQNKLLSVKGFTQRMYNKIGEDILEIIREFKPEPANEKSLPDTLVNTSSLISKGYNLKQISELLKVTEAVASLQIETIIQFRPETDISKLFSKDKFRMIENEMKDKKATLKEIKESLEGTVSYPEIRIAAAKITALKNRL